MTDKLIDELLTANVITPCGEPTEWTSPAHFVEKSGGKKARLVTDYRTLNKIVRLSFIVHPIFSPPDLIRQIAPDSRWFAKLDAVHGYFQVPLDYESSLLTAFLLPRGKHHYNVAPMGLNASSDEFNRRSNEAVCGLEYLLKICWMTC
jgi:Reverse transcriptase (RNA-dependent DNA polymerase).